MRANTDCRVVTATRRWSCEAERCCFGLFEDGPGWIVIRVNAYVHIEFPTLYPELVVQTKDVEGLLSIS
jgi:hypothetical protein